MLSGTRSPAVQLYINENDISCGSDPDKSQHILVFHPGLQGSDCTEQENSYRHSPRWLIHLQTPFWAKVIHGYYNACTIKVQQTSIVGKNKNLWMETLQQFLDSQALSSPSNHTHILITNSCQKHRETCMTSRHSSAFICLNEIKFTDTSWYISLKVCTHHQSYISFLFSAFVVFIYCWDISAKADFQLLEI